MIYGGAATCKQLSVKYGESSQFYNMGSTQLAKRIAEKTNCPLMSQDTENSKWWPILYLGRNADANTEGDWMWELRDRIGASIRRI